MVSAHYAGLMRPAQGEAREALRARQDAANNARLLERLAGAAERRASFVCTLVALRHAQDPEPLVAVGRWAGEILAAPRGSGGFGYDPLMFVPALAATVAELAAQVKNAHSHRAIAVARMEQVAVLFLLRAKEGWGYRFRHDFCRDGRRG